MRKILSLLLFFTFSVVEFSSAQISLVNTIDANMADLSKFTNVDGTIGYVFTTSAENVLKVYNSDFSLNRTITLNITNLYQVAEISRYNGYDHTIIASNHLFNNDDLLEFVVTIKDPTTSIMTFEIVNENSQVLFSKTASSSSVYGFSFGIAASTNAYLMVGYEVSTYDNKTEVYLLPGSERFDDKITGTSNGSLSVRKNESYAYPNPTSKEVNLAYSIPQGEIGQLRIFDLNGKCLKQMNVDGVMPYVKIDVSQLPASTYLYQIECDGKVDSNKFVVSK